MKEVMAVIRMNKINRTKKALIEGGVSSMTAMEALGRGKGLINMELLKGAEQGYEEAIVQLGQSDRLIPKRAISVVVPDKLVKKNRGHHYRRQPDRQIRRRGNLGPAHRRCDFSQDQRERRCRA